MVALARTRCLKSIVTLLQSKASAELGNNRVVVAEQIRQNITTIENTR